MKYILTIFFLFFIALLFAQSNNSKIECKTQFDSISNRTIYSIVDKLPEFPGGIDTMKKYISTNIKWPNDGQDDFQGTVYVSVIVETDGTLSNITILKGIYDLSDNEALRIIENMPKWKPGKCNGQIVPVKYCIPIKFRMEQK